MTFETERLILRPWAESDAEECFKYAQDPAVVRLLRWQCEVETGSNWSSWSK